MPVKPEVKPEKIEWRSVCDCGHVAGMHRYTSGRCNHRSCEGPTGAKEIKGFMCQKYNESLETFIQKTRNKHGS